MKRKYRIVFILVVVVVVALFGCLAVALSFPDSRARLGWACEDFMVKLGLYPRRCCRSYKNACIANLKQIDGAKATWALENKKTTTDIPTATDLYGANAYIRDEPACTQGGNYVIGSVQQKPRCSIPGHTL